MEKEKPKVEKIKTIGERIQSIAGYVGAVVFLWSFVAPFALDYWKGRSSSRLDEYDRMFEVYAKIVEAETDIDKKIFHAYGIELYHCNKDRRGEPKFSFVKHDGKLYEAIESKRKAGVWVYLNEQGQQIPVITLKHD